MREEKKRKHKSEHKDKKHKRSRDHKEEASEDTQAVVPNQGDVLSIDETNKLREKLGLAPLKSKEAVTETADGFKQYTLNGDTFVHKKPDNLGNRKKSEKLIEKLDIKKQKRELGQKLLNVKVLSEDKNESAASWVLKSRQLAKDKEIAAKKEKMFEELDKDFGIGQIIEQNLNMKKNYTAKDLKGVKVDHSIEDINEGETLVLTLADKDILTEMEEAEKGVSEQILLRNVNLVDKERGLKNIEIRSKKIEYKPYLDEEQYDEFGVFKPKNLLDKYDEEVGVLPDKDAFVIGEGGIIDSSEMKRDKQDLIRKIREGLNIESLETNPMEIAKEYYTHEELKAKIKKKPKKKTKLRQTMIEEEDIEPQNLDLQQPQTSTNHLSNTPTTSVTNETEGEGNLMKSIEMEEEKGLLELEEVMNRVRKMKNSTAIQDINDSTNNNGLDVNSNKPNNINKISEAIREKVSQLGYDELAVDEKAFQQPALKSSIVLNTTAEFCRTLDSNLYKPTTATQDQSKQTSASSEPLHDGSKMETDSESDESSSIDEIDVNGIMLKTKNKTSHKSSKQTLNHIKNGKSDETITLEPDIKKGLGQALEYIKSKGYLDKPEVDEDMSADYLDLKCKRFTVEDKHYELDDKHSHRRDRYSNGPIVDFKEKKEYTPDFKIDYVDDQGNVMNTKEAFRFLSHRFHGKGAGKLKVDKRAKKYLEKLKSAIKANDPSSSMETVNLLLNKQKEIKAPYLILSGKSTNISGAGGL